MIVKTMDASTNTCAESIRRRTICAMVGSMFAMLVVLGLAFPTVLGITGGSLRGSSKLRPLPTSAAAAATVDQGQRNLRGTDAMSNGEKVGSAARHGRDSNIWEITWPSETNEDGGNGFYAAWGPEKGYRSTTDEDELPKIKKSLLGLTETQRSVPWHFALENDFVELQASYSYGFDTFAEGIIRNTEDYSYAQSYEM